MRYLLRLRGRIRPEVRNGLDGLALFFAITLFICLVQSAYDGIVKRNHNFDSLKVNPIYRIVHAGR